MAEKLTEITVKFEAPKGTKKQKVRTFVRGVDGVDYADDREIDVPDYEPAEVRLTVPHTEVGQYTDDAITAWLKAEYGSLVRLAGVFHRTFYS